MHMCTHFTHVLPFHFRRIELYVFVVVYFGKPKKLNKPHNFFFFSFFVMYHPHNMVVKSSYSLNNMMWYTMMFNREKITRLCMCLIVCMMMFSIPFTLSQSRSMWFFVSFYFERLMFDEGSVELLVCCKVYVWFWKMCEINEKMNLKFGKPTGICTDWHFAWMWPYWLHALCLLLSMSIHVLIIMCGEQQRVDEW